MGILKVAVMLGAVAGALSLGGCAVYPAYPAYGPGYAPAPAVYAPAPVVVTPYPSYGWAWGGWGHGYHRHWR
ncbi:MAG TPA: hypothetical protein VL550_10765 [Rhodocyclaceae bacterium]|nr:hypothetical protein [Rhodocyclaceae bacterium]